MLLKLKTYFLLFLGIITLSCNTDSFDFDKLSGQTGITPEIRAPFAQMELNLQSFLDSLDYEIDYDRDNYGTIYVSDSISTLASLVLEDVFDISTLETEFTSDYQIESLQISNSFVELPQTSIDKIFSSLVNQQTVSISTFQKTLDFDVFELFSDDYREITFESGMLEFTFLNNFPISTALTLDLIDADGNTLFTSEPTLVGVNETSKQSYDLTDLMLNQQSKATLRIQSSVSHSNVFIDFDTQFIAIEVAILNAKISNAVLGKTKTFEYSFIENVGFENKEGVQLRMAHLDEAKLHLELINEFGNEVEFVISHEESIINGNKFERSFLLENFSSPQEFEWDLKGVNFNFNHSPQTNNLGLAFLISTTFEPGQVVEFNKEIHMTGRFSDFSLNKAFGNFGTVLQKIEESVEVSGNFFDDLLGTVTIIDPKLTVLFYNTFGVPSKFLNTFTAERKNGDHLDLITSPSVSNPIIQAPTEIYDTIITELTFDTTNSNIQEFVSFFPNDSIRTSVTIETNPVEVDYRENFVFNHSKTWIDVMLEAPVHFNVDNFSINDSLFFQPLLEIDQDVDRLLRVLFHINYTSDFPVNLEFRPQLMDTLSKEVLAQFTPIQIDPAITNERGEVTEHAQGTTQIEFQADVIEALKYINGMPFELVINSTEKETKNAVISSNSKLKIDLAATIKFNLDD